ncbi:Protein of unknown function (DUF1679) [Nesidiocoris tenuis]|uniref:CHK kinase-like domain-containing protein n=1 Tax=Nesidiocoris tenuis TaxID=355587 RepID=A0ABN7AWT1_9HEMI|nr:Protein of unknown function (DUF1679) [Nesidiocoris tenuis]
MELDKNWLETVLSGKNHGEPPVKVLDIQTEMGAIQKGENYMSKISKVRAKILLGSGETKSIGFIVKHQHETEFMKQLSEKAGVFFREIEVYRQILPKMEELLDEIGDTGVRPWGKCVDYTKYSRIIFEDLTFSGYRIADRRKRQNLDSVLLVMRELGKFHALSKVLLTRGLIPLDVFGKHLWHKSEDKIALHINSTLAMAEKTICQWGEEWKQIYDRMKKTIPNFSESFLRAVEVEPDEFTVLSHADLWTNNMLFQYGPDSERPTSIKFIDFQLTYVATPDRDLAYFLYSSARPEVVEGHFDEILQAYCDSLKGYLAKFKYEGIVPGVENVKEMLRKRTILTLGDSMMVFPFILCDFSEAPDLEDILKNESAEEKDSKLEWSAMEHLSIEAENVIKASFKRAIAHGLI